MTRSPVRQPLLRSALAQRLFVLFLFASIVPLALSDWVSSSAVSQIAESLDVSMRAQTTHKTSRQVLDRLLAGSTLLTAMSTAMPSSHRDASANELPNLAPVFRRVARVDVGSAPALTAAATVLHTRWTDAQPKSSARAPQQDGGEADRVHVTLRVYAPPGATPRVLLGAARQGKLQWLAEFDPDYLWAPVADAGEDGSWSVTDAQGTPLMSHSGGDYMPDATGSDTVETRTRLFLGAAFGAGDWNFVQRSPRTQLHWHGQPLVVWLSLVAIGTLLSAALLGRWQIRRTLIPLGQLTQGTRRLAAGAIDTRVAVSRDDEMGTLAHSFNDMAARIEAQFDAIQGLARIDREILAGAPVARLAELVARQLVALYPNAHPVVFWRDGANGLSQVCLHETAGGVRAVVTNGELTSDQDRTLSNLRVDECRLLHDGLHGDDLSHLPWSVADAAPLGTSLTLLPLRRLGRTEALIALGLADLAPSAEHTRPACELRDRLTVAFAARAREEELVYRAVHDSLTGLTNRYGLNVELDACLADADPNRRVAILFLDLDHFKDVNDSLGHDAGDELLCLAARRLQSGVAARHLLARQGGDEFAIVLTDAADDAAQTTAREAIDLLSVPFDLRGRACKLGVSIGIAFYPDHGTTRDALLRSADVALYAAKAAGRGQFAEFTTQLDALVNERTRMIADLHLALERSEFVAYYQPRVRPDGGAITSAEVLIRWQHPARGLVFPDSFIALAESCGLIDRIGLWILDAACAQLSTWRAQGVHLERISVNVSPQQLVSGALVAHVQSALARYRLPSKALELEVTESLLVGDVSGACGQLEELRRLGVSIALDDFGTGYSSMSMLRQLPIDVMKIDRSFVKDLGVDEGAMAMARTIVALAKSLQLQLVAEGVETERQASLLQSMDCDELQGYLYSKPVPPEAFECLPGLQRTA